MPTMMGSTPITMRVSCQLRPNMTAKAVENAKVLDIVAEMNYHSMMLTHGDTRVPQYLLDKHYLRKHGANAYYGQGDF